MKKTPVSRPRHALGGTLIGFVAGLLVGLGAALAVAVYVTKVPVPFVDRGLSRDAGADAKEAERNKGWNPNAAATRTPGAAPAPAAPATGDTAAGTVSVPPADGKPLPAPATARPLARPRPTRWVTWCSSAWARRPPRPRLRQKHRPLVPIPLPTSCRLAPSARPKTPRPNAPSWA